MFSKTVYFSGIGKLPDISVFKMIIEGIKSLAVPPATEKFSVVLTNFMDLLLNKKLNGS